MRGKRHSAVYDRQRMKWYRTSREAQREQRRMATTEEHHPLLRNYCSPVLSLLAQRGRRGTADIHQAPGSLTSIPHSVETSIPGFIWRDNLSQICLIPVCMLTCNVPQGDRAHHQHTPCSSDGTVVSLTSCLMSLAVILV